MPIIIDSHAHGLYARAALLHFNGCARSYGAPHGPLTRISNASSALASAGVLFTAATVNVHEGPLPLNSRV